MTLAALAVALFALVAVNGQLPVYDDALFFRRFALNLWEHGVWAWNVEDGPVHGNTSQLWQGIVALLALVAPDRVALLGRLVAAGSLLGAGALLMRDRPKAAVLVGLLSPLVLPTVLSGMETAVTVALGAVLLTVPRAAGALTVLLYAARPDTVLLTLPTLILRRQWAHLAGAVAGICALLALYHWGYGSALPLAASLKIAGVTALEPELVEASVGAGRRHGLHALLAVAPLLVWGWRGWRQALPAALFCAFHAFVSVDIMGLHGRFFAPAVPWLIVAVREVRATPLGLLWAVAVAVAFQFGAIPGDEGWAIGRVSPWTWAAFGLGTAAACFRPWLLPVLVTLASVGLGSFAAPLEDRALAMRLRSGTASWQGMGQAVRCVGRDSHAFHSEIGLPGVQFRRVTDLGGLMAPFDEPFNGLCERHRPELIWLPHRNYVRKRAEAESSACLTEGYREVTTTTAAPLWVRNDLNWDC